jgi:hypothetical protein
MPPSDEYLDRESRRARLEEVSRMQRRHARRLRYLFRKLYVASRTVDWSGLTPEQFIRYTEALLRMERLVHGQPITIVRHEHTGAEAGQIQIISAGMPIEPSPEFMANVIQILHQCGAFDDELSQANDEPKPAPDGDAHRQASPECSNGQQPAGEAIT